MTPRFPAQSLPVPVSAKGRRDASPSHGPTARSGDIRIPFAFCSERSGERSIPSVICIQAELPDERWELSPIPTKTGCLRIDYTAPTPSAPEVVKVGEYDPKFPRTLQNPHPVSFEDIKPLIDALSPRLVEWEPFEEDAPDHKETIEDVMLRNAYVATQDLAHLHFTSNIRFWHEIVPALHYLKLRVEGRIVPIPPYEAADFNMNPDNWPIFEMDRTEPDGKAPSSKWAAAWIGIKAFWKGLTGWLKR